MTRGLVEDYCDGRLLTDEDLIAMQALTTLRSNYTFLVVPRMLLSIYGSRLLSVESSLNGMVYDSDISQIRFKFCFRGTVSVSQCSSCLTTITVAAERSREGPMGPSQS